MDWSFSITKVENNPLNARIRSASAALDDGKPIRASLELETIVQENPDDESALELLGKVFCERGRHQQAIELIEATKGCLELSRGLRLILARAHSKVGNLDAAEGILDRMLKEEPEDLSALDSLADLRNLQEDFSSVARICKDILRLNPNDEKAIERLVKAKLALKDDTVLTDINRRLTANPNNVELLTALKQAQSLTSMSLENLLRDCPAGANATEADAQTAWAQVLVLSSGIEEAVEYISRVVALNPLLDDVMHPGFDLLSEIVQSEGNEHFLSSISDAFSEIQQPYAVLAWAQALAFLVPAESSRQFSRVATNLTTIGSRLQPNAKTFLGLYASMRDEEGARNLSRETLDAIVKQLSECDDVDVLLTWSTIMLECSQFDVALSALKRANSIRPNDSQNLRDLVHICGFHPPFHEEREHHVRACIESLEASKGAEHDAAIGLILFNAQRSEEAWTAFRQALSEDPACKSAIRGIRRLADENPVAPDWLAPLAADVDADKAPDLAVEWLITLAAFKETEIIRTLFDSLVSQLPRVVAS